MSRRADGSLVFDTQLDSTGLKTGLSGIGNIAKVGLSTAVAGFTAVAGAAIGATTAITGTVSATAAYGDEIDKMSQKMGISAEAYQEWDFIMEHSGASMESLKAGMKTLASAADSGNEAFARLGITEEELATLSQEDLFALTITRLQEMGESTERTAIAADLLGRGATELGALLNTSAEETQAMKDQLHELGGVMSDESVKAAAAFQDSLQNLKTAVSGTGRGLVSDMLPAVTQVMDGMTMLLSGESPEEALNMIGEGVDSVAESLGELAPRLIEIGGSVLGKLAEALVENLPTLVQAGMEVLNTLLGGIISALPQLGTVALQIVQGLLNALLTNLPMLATAAIEVVLTLAKGISEMLPELVPAVIGIILQIVTVLLDNIPLIIEAAIALYQGLIEGMIASVPQIIEAIPILITAIMDTLTASMPQLAELGVFMFLAIIENLPFIIIELCKAVPEIVTALIEGFAQYYAELIVTGEKLIGKMIDGIKDTASKLWAEATSIGSNIVDGIWEGIQGGWSWLTEKVGDLADDLFDSAKEALGIASPSKKFRYLGEMCVAGFDEGIDELMSGSAIGAAVNATFGTLSSNVTGGELATAGSSQTFNFYDTQTSPDAIRRKVQNTMTFGLAGGI